MPKNPLSIENINGTAVPILGNDVDTDRIVPARYLKEVTFDNMGEYLFYDARHNGDELNPEHPLNQPKFSQASIMVVENNFGCGSSREHAPQAIKRAGFNAIIGQSFAEIFSGNCKALGIVTATLDRDHLDALMKQVQAQPSNVLTLSVNDEYIQFGDSFESKISIKPSHKKAFIDGTWDELALLKLNHEKIKTVANNLPYFNW
ncbi:MAG: 3-isopropylmalate dehydratase small subunit [Candidatus Marinamargulisbacteria bacterium]